VPESAHKELSKEVMGGFKMAVKMADIKPEAIKPTPEEVIEVKPGPVAEPQPEPEKAVPSKTRRVKYGH
jgi:hypothetical protein